MSIGDFSTEAEHAMDGLEGDAPSEAKDLERPIDKLKPKSDEHQKVLQYLLDRLNYSERTMSTFYSRWNYNEQKLQAYINLPDYEKALAASNKTGAPPQITSIVVPYSYATIWTIVTYMVHTFCGRKPMFQVSSYKQETAENAQYMETVLQYNADHTRLILALIQWFLDAETYGVGAMRCLWNEEKAYRSVWASQAIGGLAMPKSEQMMLRRGPSRRSTKVTRFNQSTRSASSRTLVCP